MKYTNIGLISLSIIIVMYFTLHWMHHNVVDMRELIINSVTH